VATTIAQLCPTVAGKLQLRRKYKTSENGHVKRWWFLIRGEEEVLIELQKTWDHISTQTSWRLEECLMYEDLPAERSEGDMANAISPTPIPSLPPHDSPPTAMHSVNVPRTELNSPTPPPLIVSEHDTVVSDVNHPLVVDPQDALPLQLEQSSVVTTKPCSGVIKSGYLGQSAKFWQTFFLARKRRLIEKQ